MTGNERRDGRPVRSDGLVEEAPDDLLEDAPDDLFADRSERPASRAGRAAPYGGDDDLYGASAAVAPTAGEDGAGAGGR
ncbi:hypothetical protein ACFC1T_06605 [Kitasatospora sp. NPDC056076]|uniref:hypothetical protein n=1 Tax=Kitasatospora sp. NPDC056076 TaxID=3345703 RepID=UPI0035DBC272